ncbi:MAG TPA: dipeptidase [Vicinamibacteria bacterium]
MRSRAMALMALLGWAAPAGAEDAALRRARAVLERVPLIDGHNDLAWAIREYEKAPRDVVAYDLRTRTPGHTDLARLRQGHVGGQFWSVYVPGEARAQGFAKMQLEQIDIARQFIARYPDQLELALTADQVERAFHHKRVASLLGMEGGHVLENSLGALRAYYDLGVRYLTLTHNINLDWADCAAEPARHGGLTRFGEEVVREMNRLGMLVDLSHTSAETMEDALRVAAAPVIFSHSSARGLTDVPRNVPDSILKALPANGGLVMVTFVPSFCSIEVHQASQAREAVVREKTKDITDPVQKKRISDEIRRANPVPKATLAQVADHIEYVRKVAGADHVGLGGDFDGVGETPVGLDDVSSYPALFAELVRRGWSDADLEKLAGRNLLRVLRAAEATAARLQRERPPSLATIEELDAPARSTN